MDLQMRPDLRIEFYGCIFYNATAIGGGGFLYIHLHDITQINFPLLIDEKYVPTPDVTDPNDDSIVLQYDPHPYCYFGHCDVVHDPGKDILNAGIVAPNATIYHTVPRFMPWPLGIQPDTDPAEVFGQVMLVDLDIDIRFPFDRADSALDGLIDSPYADIYRIGFKFNQDGGLAQTGSVNHVLNRLDAYRRTWLNEPSILVKHFLRYVGPRILPPSEDDLDDMAECAATPPTLTHKDPCCGEEGDDNGTGGGGNTCTDPTCCHDFCKPQQGICCMHDTTACPTLDEVVSGHINSDGFILLIIPGASVNGTVVFHTAVDISAYFDPEWVKADLYLSKTATTAAHIHVLEMGMPSFYDIRFLLQDFSEMIPSSSSPIDHCVFYIEYVLVLSRCEFLKYPNPIVADSFAAAATAAALAAGKTAEEAEAEGTAMYYTELKQYACFLYASRGSMFIARTSFTNITMSAGAAGNPPPFEMPWGVYPNGGRNPVPWTETKGGKLIWAYYSDLIIEPVAASKKDHFNRIIRSSFINISSAGDGGCFYMFLGKFRTTFFTECTFSSVTSAGHGGVFFLVCSTLMDLWFNRNGKGFTIRNDGNGGYDCPKKNQECLPNDYHDSFYGKTIMIVLLDSSIPTPTPHTLSNLDGLIDFYLEADQSHVLGFREGEGTAEKRLKVFKLSEILRPMQDVPVDCDDIDADYQERLCLENQMGCEIHVSENNERFCVARSTTGQNNHGASLVINVLGRRRTIVFVVAMMTANVVMMILGEV